MMMKQNDCFELNDKVIVLTGGAGVLGETIAKELAKDGAKIAILDLNHEHAVEIKEEIVDAGQAALAIECNVLKKESIAKARDEVLDEWGRVDVLINGAGGNHPDGTTDDEFFDSHVKEDIKTFFDLKQEGINFVFNLNFLGTLLPTQVFAKEMVKNGGNIINISSMNAFSPLTKIPAYSGAKAAVSNFTEWLAVYFSKTAIRVNAIAPGFFITKQNEALLMDDKGDFTARARKILRNTPMNRFGKPLEIIGPLKFLLSDRASGFVNGVVLPIDGGFNAYSGV